jgi:hypothetical protein
MNEILQKETVILIFSTPKLQIPKILLFLNIFSV